MKGVEYSMSILAEHIAEYYVKNNIISKDDKDMYVFGISLIESV